MGSRIIKIAYIISILFFVGSVVFYVYTNKDTLIQDSSNKFQPGISFFNESNAYVKESRIMKSYSGTIFSIEYLYDSKNLAKVTLKSFDENLRETYFDITIPDSFIKNSLFKTDKEGNIQAISEDEFNDFFVKDTYFYMEISSSSSMDQSYVNYLKFTEK